MSNNKQSSVELLFDHMVGLCEDYDDGKINYTQYCNGVKEMYQKAKAMHEEEIMTAHLEGQCDTTIGYPMKIAQQYYNETYGGNK